MDGWTDIWDPVLLSQLRRVNLRMETRHPVGDHLLVNIRWSVIIAELRRPKVAKPGSFMSNFWIFWKNDPLWGQNSVLKVYMAKLTLLCSNVVQFVRGEIDEIVRYIPDKKKQNFGCLSNWFSFGGVIVERVKTVFCPIEYLHHRLFKPIIISRHFTECIAP